MPDLKSELAAARAKIASLESENRELSMLLDVTTSHSDAVTEELQQDKEDLEIMVETTVNHADLLEEELQQKAEDALRESESRLRLIVEATPVPILIARRSDALIVYVNNLVPALFDANNDNILQQPLNNYFASADDYQRTIRALDATGTVDHEKVEIRTASGPSCWVDMSLRTLTFESEKCVLAALNDITDLVNINIAASRFVPSEWMGFLDKHSITDLALGDHVSRSMSVMFTDIRAFTDISEDMTPEQNFDFVNEYLRRVSPVITDHTGMIVKFLGDGIMAVFPDQSTDAVDAGIATLHEVTSYNQYRQKHALHPIQVGIGLNTGPMMVGMVGYDKRIQGDAFSDAVNLTSRVEALTKNYGTSFLITADTKDSLAADESYDIRFVDRVRVKGKRESLDLFEVFNADPAPERELKKQTLPLYQSAVDAYYNGEHELAQSKLFAVLQKNPSDKVAWNRLLQATRALDEGTTDGWDITVMTNK